MTALAPIGLVLFVFGGIISECAVDRIPFRVDAEYVIGKTFVTLGFGCVMVGIVIIIRELLQ